MSRLYSWQQASQPRSTRSSTTPVAVRNVSRFATLLRPQGLYGFHRGRRSYSGSILLFARLILIVVIICIRHRARGTIRRISVRDSFVLRCFVVRGRAYIIDRCWNGRILRRERFGNLRDIVFLCGPGTCGGPRLDSKVSVIVEVIIVLRRQHDINDEYRHLSAVLKTIYSTIYKT